MVGWGTQCSSPSFSIFSALFFHHSRSYYSSPGLQDCSWLQTGSLPASRSHPRHFSSGEILTAKYFPRSTIASKLLEVLRYSVDPAVHSSPGNGSFWPHSEFFGEKEPFQTSIHWPKTFLGFFSRMSYCVPFIFFLPPFFSDFIQFRLSCRLMSILPGWSSFLVLFFYYFKRIEMFISL